MTGMSASKLIRRYRQEDAERDTERSERDPRHQAKQRKCLRCQLNFQSQWAGHRLCEGCTNYSRTASGRIE